MAIYDLRRAEWIAVGIVVVAILVVNKIVIRDEGSRWLTLLVVSLSTGLAVVHTARRLRRRGRTVARPAESRRAR